MSSVETSLKVAETAIRAVPREVPGLSNTRAPTNDRIVEALSAAPKISVQELSQDALTRKSGVGDQLDKTVEDIKAAVQTLNSTMKKIPTTLQFSVDSASNRVIVQVTNNDTGEVVRTLPGEAVLKIAQNLESLKGILFDDAY